MLTPFTKRLNVLVDYANINREIKRRGLDFIIDSLLFALPSNTVQSYTDISFRLYGGWYQNSSPTRLCQDLATAIASGYPKATRLAATSIFINVELVYSLALFPTRQFFSTYRRRSKSMVFSCEDRNGLGCIDSQCPMDAFKNVIDADACPKCGRDLGDFISLDEQKLVDSMMVVDLLFYAQTGESIIVLVSADDDMWPGIITANSQNLGIIHVNPRKPQSWAYNSYLQMCNPSIYTYIQL